MSDTAQFGMIGLGVMGAALVRNLSSKGITVAAWDLSPEQGAELNGVPGVTRVATLEELVSSLERPRRLQLMVPSGKPVDMVVASLRPLLEKGDIVIDGGNSAFERTDERARQLAEHGIDFVGMGVSGGEQGALEGPSMMPGGSAAGWERLAPVLEKIAAHTPAGPCVTHVGTGGAGHFVKTVHNGIEYADMQLIVETYDLLRRAMGQSVESCATRFAGWNGGRLASYLIEITAKILDHKDTSGAPLVEAVLDRAGQKGTGRWTVQAAVGMGVAVPTIAAALDARVLSSDKAGREQREAAFGSPAIPAAAPSESLFEALEQALFASKLLAYAQGFELIRSASAERHWGIVRAELARIWMGGCIIRAELLTPVRAALEADPELPNLAFAPTLLPELRAALPGLRRIVSLAVEAGVPVPALSASLAYADSLRTANLPQNLLQAQRDAFGAHTYQRRDDPDGPAHHSDWLDD